MNSESNEKAGNHPPSFREDWIEKGECFPTDITERKQTEIQLAYLASFPERNPYPIMEMGVGGDIRYMNPATRHLFPDLREQGLMHPWLKKWDEVLRLFNEGHTDSISHEVTVDDRWYHQTFFYIPEDQAVRIYSSDVTQLKQAKESLRKSEELRHVLTETMLQGVVHQNAEGTIIAMNPAAERILGKSHEQFLGSSSTGEEHDTIREDGSLFPGLEHPAMVALRTGQPVRGVPMGVFNPKVNAYRWISIDAVPLFQPGEKRPYQVYAVFEDITERKLAEESLRKSHEELEQRVAERTRELTKIN